MNFKFHPDALEEYEKFFKQDCGGFERATGGDGGPLLDCRALLI